MDPEYSKHIKCDENCIGISTNRLHHIMGVARAAYKIAKNYGFDECFAKKMFVLGFNHDIGYEFCNVKEMHPEISAELLKNCFTITDSNELNAIMQHGKYVDNCTWEWKILNIADMTTDSKGNEVDVTQRLDDIKKRFGEHSSTYMIACDICARIGLIDADSINSDQFGG